MPASAMARVMAEPAPCTSTGRIPTLSMKTTSTNRCPSAPASSSTLPPQLDHRDLVAELADPPQGLDQDIGFLNSFLQCERSPEHSQYAWQPPTAQEVRRRGNP